MALVNSLVAVAEDLDSFLSQLMATRHRDHSSDRDNPTVVVARNHARS